MNSVTRAAVVLMIAATVILSGAAPAVDLRTDTNPNEIESVQIQVSSETEPREDAQEAVPTLPIDDESEAEPAESPSIEPEIVCKDIESESKPEFESEPKSDPIRIVLSATATENDGFFYYEEYFDERWGRFVPVPMSEEWQLFTYEMCVKYNVRFEMILALMGVETGFDVEIGSRYDIDGVHEYYGPGMVHVEYNEERLRQQGIELKTVEGGIEAVCSIMRDKLIEFDEDMHHALMAYNYGSGGAQSAINEGRDTSDYSMWVESILNGLIRYRESR